MSLKQLSFNEEARRDDSKRDSVELPINGEVYYAYRPSTNSLGLFYSSQGSRGISEKLKGIEDFLQKNLEPEAFNLVMKGVRDDAINYEVLLELTMDIIEEFAENPTTSSPVSSPSQNRAGRRSTASARPKARTRVSSNSRVSAD